MSMTKNGGKKLTRDLIFTKTKSDSLHTIKNLNLWGSDLEDLSLIQEMPNLEVVSLSVNRISSLKQFNKCFKLQELYLRKNNIEDLNEIQHLMKLPNLKVLWLHDNPCSEMANYRQIIIKNLPNLMKLDNNPINNDERASCQTIPNILEKNIQQQQHHYEKQEQCEKQQQYEKQQQSRQHIQIIPIDSNQVHSKWSKKTVQQEEKSQVGSNRPLHSASKQQRYGVQQQLQQQNNDMQRNQNIVMAVLTLIQELDNKSLQIIRREADKLCHNE